MPEPELKSNISLRHRCAQNFTSRVEGSCNDLRISPRELAQPFDLAKPCYERVGYQVSVGPQNRAQQSENRPDQLDTNGINVDLPNLFILLRRRWKSTEVYRFHRLKPSRITSQADDWLSSNRTWKY